MHLDEVAWKRIFNSLKNTCKEAKLKEFQFKLIHRIEVTKKRAVSIRNYTTLFMRYYIHSCKMQKKAIHLSTFVDKVLSKYRIEKFS